MSNHCQQSISKSASQTIEQLFHQALKQQQAGELEEALVSYVKLINYHQINNPVVFNNLGSLYLSKQQFDLAQEKFRQALALNTDYLSARFNLAVCLYQQQQYMQAMEQLNFVLQQEPEDTEALLYLGRCHFALQYFQQAQKILEELVGKKIISNEIIDSLLYIAHIYKDHQGLQRLVALRKQAIRNEYSLLNEIHNEGKTDATPLPCEFYDLQRVIYVGLQQAITAGCFAGDYLISEHIPAFLQDEQFMQALMQHPTSQALGLVWRLHIACMLAKRCLVIEGDFIECGVEKGITSMMLSLYLNWQYQTKHLYLYDTFCGIPIEYKNNDLNHTMYQRAGLYDYVNHFYCNYENIKVIKGALPDSLNLNQHNKIAFLHMDLGNFSSEHDTLAKVIDRMMPGGMVLFQSVGLAGYDCHQIASTSLLKDRDLQILELPTGQGILQIPL